MDYKRENVKRDGVSCNFCDRGTMGEGPVPNLVYPYDEVNVIKREGKRGGVSVAICDACMVELTNHFTLMTATDKTSIKCVCTNRQDQHKTREGIWICDDCELPIKQLKPH